MKAKYKSCRYHGKRMREHRAVYAEEMLEYGYSPAVIVGMVIHHADGNKMNNDPLNLILMSRSAHSSMHARGQKRGMNGRFVC